MKNLFSVQYVPGEIGLLYLFDHDNSLLLVVKKCQASSFVEYIHDSEYIPDFLECDYHDEHESFIFQESLVWDKSINFFTLIELQKQVKYYWDYLITQDYIEIEI